MAAVPFAEIFSQKTDELGSLIDPSSRRFHRQREESTQAESDDGRARTGQTEKHYARFGPAACRSRFPSRNQACDECRMSGLFSPCCSAASTRASSPRQSVCIEP